jgi:UDP-GlcNAc3NAcA epimerase
MLIALEKILIDEKPDMVMVYGDTNSTLAGALAAAKLHIPVCHVEAGLRSFNMNMPEEINRILTDRVSQLLFCPTQTAVDNLMNEGYNNLTSVSIQKVGDVMQDATCLFADSAEAPAGWDAPDQGFILATIHRAGNTDDPVRLKAFVEALNLLHRDFIPVVMPLHPRTRNAIKAAGLKLEVDSIDPVGYLQMIWLLEHSNMVLTDSGGLQKEAFFFNKPCITLRDQTEWTELVEAGANMLVEADVQKIIKSVQIMQGKTISDPHSLYGGGMATNKIANALKTFL